jgi:Cu(I)/Ag(I) efflux system membrane fusion protein
MQNANVVTENLTVKEGDYVTKNEVVFRLVNTDKVWGIFNVLQGYSSLIKKNQSIRISSELDEKDFIDAKVNFIETQFNQADKSNRIRVYLNNTILKLPIGLRLQGIIESNPIEGMWIPKEGLVSIGNKKIVFLKMNNGFKVKEVKIGIENSDFVQIINGISVQDTIAKNAQYLIDSESFIKTE